MRTPPLQYQCRACGAIVTTHERLGHLGERYDLKVSGRQLSDAFTTTLDPFHPGRASKWGYDEEEIRVVIPDLPPTPTEEPTA